MRNLEVNAAATRGKSKAPITPRKLTEDRPGFTSLASRLLAEQVQMRGWVCDACKPGCGSAHGAHIGCVAHKSFAYGGCAMIFATTKLLPAAGTGVRFSTLFRAWTKLTFIDWAITLLQW